MFALVEPLIPEDLILPLLLWPFGLLQWYTQDPLRLNFTPNLVVLLEHHTLLSDVILLE
jgi:hypothetical protein